VGAVNAATLRAKGAEELRCLIDAFLQPPMTVGKVFFVLLGDPWAAAKTLWRRI
jgi:hypothetical protein